MIDAPSRSKFVFPNSSSEYEGHLSPSQVVEWLRCPACYELNRIRKLPRPLGINLPIGSAVHRAVEQARLGSAGWEDAAADWFTHEISQPTDEETGQPLDTLEIDLGSKYTTLDQAKDEVVRLVRFAVPQILALDKQRGKVVACEYNLVELPQPWPFRIEARLDVLYADWLSDPKPENATLMADLKTAKDLRGPDEYVALAQGIYERFWSSRGLPLTVMADVVSKTKQPELQSFSLTIDDYARQQVYQVVMDVAENISAGRFPPRPGYWCSWVHGWPEFSVAVSGFPE
jgi:hypothetical protein